MAASTVIDAPPANTLELVQRLMALPPRQRAAAAAELLAQHADPRMQLMSQMMLARPAESDDAADDDRDESFDEPVGSVDQRRRASRAAALDRAAPTSRVDEVTALRRQLARVTAERNRLRAINDAVAAALGACPRCWGDDPRCSQCAGVGTPGARDPNRDAFEELVVPVLHRLQPADQPIASSGSPSGSSSGPPSTPSSHPSERPEFVSPAPTAPPSASSSSSASA
jgi:hypothetical protein